MRTLIILTLITLSAQAEFAIRDGDTVVFLGDSITAARQYSKIIEDYTLLRFPKRHVRFINAGKGGETAKGSLERLDEAVFAQGATLLTVAYGVNDIGWGMRADETHKKEYLDAIGELIDRCQKHRVRVFICSAAITAENPDTAENGFLQKMCDEGMALAKAKGEGAIDVQRKMREAQRRVVAANAKEPDKSKQARMHVDDGVHLNDLGQFAMAWAILKGLGAPAEVSAVTVDAAKLSVVSSEACKVSGIHRTSDELTFTRVDESLPLNLQPLWMLHGFYIPIGDDLNRYMLTIRNLPEGKYEITAGGRALGVWSASDLGRGVNIASASADPWVPGGPWDAQAHALKVFTDMRDEIVFARQGLQQAIADSHPTAKKIDAHASDLERKLVKLQREIAQPIPVQFVVRKATSK